MLKLKVQDVRLRGCGFTLFPAARENGVDELLMDTLLVSLYSKMGLCSLDYEATERIIKENPALEDTLSISDVSDAEALINAGLLSKEPDNQLKLTSLSIKILKRAAEIQNELDAKGFTFCPCHSCF